MIERSERVVKPLNIEKKMDFRDSNERAVMKGYGELPSTMRSGMSEREVMEFILAGRLLGMRARSWVCASL
jgi:hypothetical protein